MPQVWRARFNTFTVIDADETGWLSDGDEPVMAMIGFHSLFGHANSTSVWRQPIDGDAWPRGVQANLSYPIPPVAGELTYPAVTSLGAPEPPIHVLGFAIIALEGDNTPLSFVSTQVDEVCQSLREHVERLVALAQINVTDATSARAQINDAIAQTQNAISLTWLQKVGQLAASGGDPSDPADGPGLRIFSNSPVLGDSPFGNLLSHGYSFHQDVTQSGAFHYRVYGGWEIVHEDPEPEPEFAPYSPECTPVSGNFISLPEAFAAGLAGQAGRIRFEMEIAHRDGSPTQKGFSGLVSFEPGYWYDGDMMNPPGLTGRLFTAQAAECVNGRPTGRSWTMRIVAGRDNASWTLNVTDPVDVFPWPVPLSYDGIRYVAQDDGTPRTVSLRAKRIPTIS